MLTKSDIVILGNLIDERLLPFRTEMNERFTLVDVRIDAFEEHLNDRFSLIDARFIVLEQAIYDTREDVADLRTSIQSFAVSLDALTKSMSEIRMEYTAINIELSRHEQWIQELADKAGIKFT